MIKKKNNNLTLSTEYSGDMLPPMVFELPIENWPYSTNNAFNDTLKSAGI